MIVEGLLFRVNFQVVTSAVFACVGTAGQRCTTLRRLIVHEDLYDEVIRVSALCCVVFRLFHFMLPHFWEFILCFLN